MATYLFFNMAAMWHLGFITRRPASADRTARRQFQATGQPGSSLGNIFWFLQN